MVISTQQIRAGRALKNWTQAELARAAKLAVPTIANIESGKTKPNAKTLTRIRAALEKVNIEFTENNGVRKKTDTIRVLRGQKEYMAFFDMVYEFVKKNNEPIYLNNVDETYYERWYPGFYQSEYVRKMRQLGKKLDFRITVKEGNNYFPVKEYATYRWLPENQFSPIAFEVFGDHLAIKLFGTDEPIIFLIRDKKCADVYREKFLKIWNGAIIPPAKLK